MKDNKQNIEEVGHCDKSYAYTLSEETYPITVGNHEYQANRIIYNDPRLGEGGLVCFDSVIENTYVDYNSIVFNSRIRDSRITDGSFIQNLRGTGNYERFGLDRCVIEASRVIDNTRTSIINFNHSQFKNSNVINYSGDRLKFSNSTAVFESDKNIDVVTASTIIDSFIISEVDSTVNSHTLYENYIHSNYANKEEALKKFNLS